jgi:hypothetical protein
MSSAFSERVATQLRDPILRVLSVARIVVTAGQSPPEFPYTFVMGVMSSRRTPPALIAVMVSQIGILRDRITGIVVLAAEAMNIIGIGTTMRL